jgi:hypothetical protein
VISFECRKLVADVCRIVFIQPTQCRVSFDTTWSTALSSVFSGLLVAAMIGP